MNPHNIQVCAEVRPELTLEAGRPVSCARPESQPNRTGGPPDQTAKQIRLARTTNTV
jgi:hypothetical protein